MPAAVVRGIIISVSIITALSIAVLETPQVQEWLQQQRVRIAELLRSIGEELDPESRRQAEAFAFENRTPANDPGLRRESRGSQDATAVATGRSMSNSSGTVRRIPVRGPSDPDEAEERRRKGREYLARRNQQMHELQERRRAAKAAEASTDSPVHSSFDTMVDKEGRLKTPIIQEKELPSPPTNEPMPEKVQHEAAQSLLANQSPILVGESGMQMGSQLADPFSDEHAMDLDLARSETPKPPVPPKIALDHDEPRHSVVMPGTYEPLPQEEQPEEHPEELTYEEQLAIALSLSEAEGSADAATVRKNRPEEDDEDLKAAIAASLKDMDEQQAAHLVAHAEPLTPKPVRGDDQPLVDLTPPSPNIPPQSSRVNNYWGRLIDPAFSPSNEPLTLAQPPVSEAPEDELYRVTPELTRARLASLEPTQTPEPQSAPYDPVRDAADSQAHWAEPTPPAGEASFYSAASPSSPPPTYTSSRDATSQPIVSHDVLDPEGARTPTTATASSFGFETDSDSDTFASVTDSRTQSRAPSAMSDVEVVDISGDSDVDMLSEEGDGIATPDSWTEVGSRDGEDSDEDRQHHAGL